MPEFSYAQADAIGSGTYSTGSVLAPVQQRGSVDITNIRKRFANGVVALEDISLKISSGSFFTLLGPSGCGKTTLLRMIGGFETIVDGDIAISGRSVVGVPAHERQVNTVFQSYALFPHMTVRENIEFGLKMRRIPRPERNQRVLRMIESMQIGEHAERKPNQLSGGQKQRVALARALINEPDVVLLDEPLSALDAKLRRELQLELLRLQKKVGMTFIFVTHDQEEAMIMGDHIGIMNHGRLQQVGRVSDIYEHPRNTFVARFLGIPNIIRLTQALPHNAFTTPIGELRHVPTLNASIQHVTVHPEDITLLAPTGTTVPSDTNILKATIKDVLYMGAKIEYIIDINGVELLASTGTHGETRWRAGSEVTAAIEASDIIPLEG
ncbi:ABC transporter ATP-binding protein [Acidithiobacillus ferrianus]|uniref:ATP-binding cassette domain-containing protein n=2 Tax=Acidithiobacillus ferrianus TaxID=2678518 RepID=A0A845U6Z8_9PROT|nr:ABC transporter ATP-binding protein [Acidithiobacillus ferrianus]NDU43156.1 ATP-binding cassette domain-containing protein [Acidithiobacillus ferrianus]